MKQLPSQIRAYIFLQATLNKPKNFIKNMLKQQMQNKQIQVLLGCKGKTEANCSCFKFYQFIYQSIFIHFYTLYNQNIINIDKVLSIKFMTTLKDKGTKLFKQQKFQKAIQCYSQYVKTQHKDNKAVFFNLALCFFKLKKYQECILACKQAIQLDPEYTKVYYRLFQSYKQLNDVYNTFISGVNFIKNSSDQQERSKMLPILKEYKSKISFQERSQTKQVKLLLVNISNFIQQVQQEQNVKTQQYKQRAHQQLLQQKWKLIAQEIKQNIQYGTNIAHQFIYKLKDQNLKTKYQKILKNIRRQAKGLPLQHHLQKQSPQTTVAIQNQVQKQQTSQQKQQQKQTEQIIIKTEQQQPLNSTTTQESADTIKAEYQKDKLLQHQNEVKQPLVDNNQQSEEDDDKLIDENQVIALYYQYIEEPLKQEQDLFQGFKRHIHLIADSQNLDRIQKRLILLMAAKRLKRFALIMKSYSGKQKLQIESSFRKQKLDEVIPYYFKK